ncbi:MAG: OmpA family protein [Candidatus Thiodiazotropha sp. (ex Dulcina madagascariensis)]|nr:OmpA family protein [Candidatus Thiodiazotropha sp. (ex Dulcina madagascariensis)]MCU7926617.1 OmpA family protein [Candidatus Thiodiazotropha sp. (ex Dulcina madagascariensis)]
MKNRLRFSCLMIMGLLFSGCTTAPTLSEYQVMEEYEAISAFKSQLAEDEANALFDLAPMGFAAARAKLAEAISLGRTRRDEQVAATVAEGRSILDKAESDASLSKELMREVLEARQLAVAAGADTMLRERFEALDGKLRKASEQVEQGEIEAAKKWRPEMLLGYAEVELEALKQDATENARYDIAQATNSEADEFAPKTLKLALEELALSVAVLETNRSQRKKAKNHALRASELAKQSIEITEMIKDFERRDYSREEIILWYQKQLSLINEPTGEALPFDRPNHEVVTLLRDKLVNFASLQQAELATRIDLQSRLEAVERENREAQARFDKIQDLFSADEANVYRQGHNVLLELRAFNFPSGGSDIQAENFALLDKIVTAVKSFPNPNVVVSGHTDSVGGAEVNQTLSQQRAETVASFLEKVGGVDKTRLTAIGYGESRPVANNETELGRKSNRRIEVLIINE